MKLQSNSNLHIISLWMLLSLVSLFSRSYIPIDETRYVAVAWNMWLNHDYLVPYLNGETYSHKPPLLFWLMNIGWHVFGVNDWWPRLIPSLFGLGAVFITQRIALRLWSDRDQLPYLSALILIGSSMWAVFTTALMFDMMVAFFTVLGIFGLLVAVQGESRKGWLLFTFSIAGGLLAKGPAILLQLLPVALLAPWWFKSADVKVVWRQWYLALLVAVLIGCLILLAWAIPAGISGGPKYQHEIFWGQTADRMVKSFAHQRPVYWYLPMMPVILFPWLFALPVWRAIGRSISSLDEIGVRFCLAWFLPVLIAFSFISGKQPHYLLPIVPAFALLVARGWVELSDIKWFDRALLAIVGLVVAGLIFYLPIYNQTHDLAPWVSNIPLAAGILLAFAAITLMFGGGRDPIKYIQRATLLGVFLIVTIYVGVIRVSGPAYDMRVLARQLKSFEDENIPLANVGVYHGQYNFLGRLHQSPEYVPPRKLDAWFLEHPNGRAIYYFEENEPLGQVVPEYLQAYRGILVGVLNRSQWNEWSKQPHDFSAAEKDSE